jgi:hypothetical protein
MAGRIPPQFLPGYVKKSASSVPTVKAPTGPPKTATTKAPPETIAQKAENIVVLTKVLKANSVDPKTASTIVRQFKAQDN